MEAKTYIFSIGSAMGKVEVIARIEHEPPLTALLFPMAPTQIRKCEGTTSFPGKWGIKNAGNLYIR